MSSTVISFGNITSSAQIIGRVFESPSVFDHTPIVFVLDGDASVRDSLERVIQREGWQPRTFASAQEFLANPRASVPNCLVLDVSLPGFNGLDVQKRVAVERPDMSIIFIAAHADVPTTVQAMKVGAVEFLVKPFREDTLLSSIREGLARSRLSLAHEAEVQLLRDRYSALSRREREVMTLVASGLLNKQVGGELGISEITVKAHRGRMMQKMAANSLADLVRMAARLCLTDIHSGHILRCLATAGRLSQRPGISHRAGTARGVCRRCSQPFRDPLQGWDDRLSRSTNQRDVRLLGQT